MSKDFAAALVHMACPICGREVEHSIIINNVLTEENAKKVKDADGKAIGISKNACKECIKFKDVGIICVAIDAEKSDKCNVYRTGQMTIVKKDVKLFKDYPEYINTTENGVDFCFMDEKAGVELHIFKEL